MSLVKVADVANELGVSVATALVWIKRGALPAIRMGRTWRVQRAILDAIKRDGVNLTPTAQESAEGPK